MEWKTSLLKKIEQAPSTDWKGLALKILVSAFSAAKKHDILSDSRALSYTFILSLVPLLVIAFTFFQLFGGLAIFLENTIKPILAKNFPPSVAAQLGSFIDSLFLNMSTGTIGAVSFATLIATVIALMLNIESSFNKIIETESQRPYYRRIASYWILLSVSPLVVVLSAAKSSELIEFLTPAIGQNLEYGGLFEGIRFFIGHGIQIFGFMSLYYILPEKKMRGVSVFWSGLFTHLIFQLLASLNVQLSTLVFSNRTNLQIYGSIPLLILVFLIWVRLAWLAILFGACMSSVIEKEINPEIKPAQDQPWQSPAQTILRCVKVLNSHLESFRSHSTPQSPADLVKILKLPAPEIALHHTRLASMGLLLPMQFEGQNCYIPTMKALNYCQDPRALASELLDLPDLEATNLSKEENESHLVEEVRKTLAHFKKTET